MESTQERRDQRGNTVKKEEIKEGTQPGKDGLKREMNQKAYEA